MNDVEAREDSGGNSVSHDPVAIARARTRVQPVSSSEVLRPLSEALCDPVRLKIVLALASSRLSVKDLATVIDRSQSSTSQHLRVLRRIQAVESRREGRRVLYALAEDGLGPRIVGLITALERAAS
jgi:DNA-binding transcriptional ArsR family regulator